MMRAKKDDLFSYFKQVPNLNKYRGWFLAFGVLLVLLGGVAIGYAHWATEVTVVVLGFLLVGGGILQLVNGCYAARWTGFTLALVLALFYIVAGLLCIAKPMQSAAGISLIIAMLLMVGGLMRLISSLRYRFERWGLVFFNGVVSLLLGMLILAEWPASALWVIGLFVGIDMIFVGCYWVWLSRKEY